MDILRQLTLLFSVCIAGNLVSTLTGGLLSGNVLSMVLLLVLLLAGLLRPSAVEQAADFFLRNMAFFFLPSALGILRAYDGLRAELWKLLLICTVTTFLTAAAAGWTVALVRRLLRKEDAPCTKS